MTILFRFCVLTCVVLAVSIMALGQEQAPVNKALFFPVPAESVLLTVASQPDCPLKIEEARLLASVNGKLQQFYDYRLNNVGEKSIESYTLAVWTAEAAGSTLTPTKLDVLLLPGQRTEFVSGKRNVQVVPITEELRKNPSLAGPLRIVAVLMIQTVRFSDGSVYSAEDLSSSLQEYFLKLNESSVTGSNQRRRRPSL